MAKLDLDRLERLAGGLAVLFYGLLFLAFITAIMGSGAGGLLLLALGAAAHVGRVGLEELVAKRRATGGAAAAAADDSERATGLRLGWLPREIRLGAGKPAAEAVRGRAGELLGPGIASVRPSLAALVAEIRERPGPGATAPDLEFDLGDFEEIEPEPEAFEVPAFLDEDDPGRRVEPAPEERAGADAPTAQERYEARRRARSERGAAEPIAATVEAAETRAPQRVRRRDPGGRPDPLQTRRPTRTV